MLIPSQEEERAIQDMSEIFISYAHEDKATAQRIAKSLEAKGWSVWWDRKISPGKIFDMTISNALKDAKCVVVLWSKFSVESDWVKEEAEEGNRRKILIPVMIDNASIPLGFRRVQAANLTTWNGSFDAPEFQEFTHSETQLLGNGTSGVKEPAFGNEESRPHRTELYSETASTLLLARLVTCGFIFLLFIFLSNIAFMQIAALTNSDSTGIVTAIIVGVLGISVVWWVWRKMK